MNSDIERDGWVHYSCNRRAILLPGVRYNIASAATAIECNDLRSITTNIGDGLVSTGIGNRGSI